MTPRGTGHVRPPGQPRGQPYEMDISEENEQMEALTQKRRKTQTGSNYESQGLSYDKRMKRFELDPLLGKEMLYH